MEVEGRGRTRAHPRGTKRARESSQPWGVRQEPGVGGRRGGGGTGRGKGEEEERRRWQMPELEDEGLEG